jgi:hypothetical protein
MEHAKDDRYRILVDGITDYAVYMLNIKGAISAVATPTRSVSRSTTRANALVPIFYVLHRRRP